MIKTWLDRLEEAKARGYFLTEDLDLWSVESTCPAAEIVRNCGVHVPENLSIYSNTNLLSWHPVWDLGDKMGFFMRGGFFNEFEDLYHDMEDLALSIKRGQCVPSNRLSKFWDEVNHAMMGKFVSDKNFYSSFMKNDDWYKNQ